jgi:hypothetical protein
VPKAATDFSGWKIQKLKSLRIRKNRQRFQNFAATIQRILENPKGCGLLVYMPLLAHFLMAIYYSLEASCLCRCLIFSSATRRNFQYSTDSALSKVTNWFRLSLGRGAYCFVKWLM